MNCRRRIFNPNSHPLLSPPPRSAETKILSRRCIRPGKWPTNECRFGGIKSQSGQFNEFNYNYAETRIDKEWINKWGTAFLRNLRQKDKTQFSAVIMVHTNKEDHPVECIVICLDHFGTVHKTMWCGDVCDPLTNHLLGGANFMGTPPKTTRVPVWSMDHHQQVCSWTRVARKAPTWVHRIPSSSLLS